MFVKRNGTAIISTVIILSLMTTLGMLLLKMSKNNNELSYLYKFKGDIYDLDENEEKELKKFMEELNNINTKEKNIFEENFKKEIANSTINYEKSSNKLILKTKKNNGENREREIKYIFKNEKIVLFPTYKFNDFQV